MIKKICFITGEATKSNSRCSYKNIAEGKVIALGMPEGIALKRPASYGRQGLQAIIAHQEHITFGELLICLEYLVITIIFCACL